MEFPTSMAARHYAAARTATAAKPGDPKSQLATAADDFMATVRSGEQTALSALSGDADPHALVQALAQTELAVETVVTVRDKVVEAYQEILRMPV